MIFNLLEGESLNCEQGKTYVRSYAKDEVRRILTRANLTFKAFDTVEHDPEHVRLLVVAEKT